MTKEFDVIVIGAGPAGSASSFFLSKAGLKVLMVDKATFPRDKTCGDALSNRACKIIDKMGALGTIKELGISVSSIRFIPPNKHEITLPIPHIDQYRTVVIPRYILDDKLKEYAKKSGVTMVEDFKVKSVQYQENSVTVSNGIQQYTGKLLVFATGANTLLLRKIGVLKSQPEIMHASRVYFQGVENLDEVIFNYDFSALPSYGWIFPLPNGGANVGAGFYRTKFNQNKLPSSAQQTLKDYLALPSTIKILGNAKINSDVKGYPLRVDYLSAPKFTKRGIIVGEAAGLVSPITGEGIDYALESGEIAAKYILSMFLENDFSQNRFKNYQILLDKVYRSHFRQYNWIRDTIFSNASLLNFIIKKAGNNSVYGEKFLNVSLRNISPINILYK